MHTFPSQMKPLFLASGKPKVSALSLIAMFEIEWSPQGSNQREAEEAVVFGWTEYIHDMEGELWNIFACVNFITEITALKFEINSFPTITHARDFIV